MSEENLEDFDSFFSDLQTELMQDTGRPIAPEEAALLEDNEKTKTVAAKADNVLEVKVPKSEADFISEINGTGDEDEEDDDKNPKTKTLESTDDEDDNSEYFKVVGEGLLKLGKYKEVPADFKWSQENFLEFFDGFTKEKAQADIEDILTENWGEEGIEMFKDIFINKVPIKDYLERYSESQDYSTIDLEKVGNQKYIIQTYLESTGVDEDEIFERIELLEEQDKLKLKAEAFRDKLVEESKAEMKRLAQQEEFRIQQAKAVEKKRQDAITEAVNNAIKAKEINGIPLSVADNRELLPYLTAPAYKLNNGQKITEFDKDLMELRRDPNKLTKLIALAKMVKDDLNVTPIKNKAVDETKEDLFAFNKKSKVPSKDTVQDQLDAIFSRKSKKI